MAGSLPPSRARHLILAAVALAALCAAPRAAGPANSGSAAAIPPWFPSGPPSPEFLARLPKDVHVDNFGNAWVTRGSGSPHVLVLAHRDAPGYVVSQITADGYLRLQRLGTPASPLFDQFMVGKRLVVYTQRGMLPAVVTAPSTHFRRGANVPVPEATVDDLWIDVGAESDDEAREMGIALLDPVVPIDHTRGALEAGIDPLDDPVRGYAAGVRSACAIVSVVSEEFQPTRGSLTCAWTAGGTEGGRGSRRLVDRLGEIDSVIVVEPVPYGGRDSVTMPWYRAPGIAAADSAHGPSVHWANSVQLDNPQLTPRFPFPIVPEARVWTAEGVPTLVVGCAVANAGTAGELGPGAMFGATVEQLVERALGPDSFHPQGEVHRATDIGYWSGERERRRVRASARPRWGELIGQESEHLAPHPEAWGTIAPLLRAYGVSEHESQVAAAVRATLPAGAARAAVLDARGNLELHLGEGPPRRIFVAHLDEIGYRVTAMDSLKRARVERKGGFYDWLYEGETVRIQPPSGPPIAGIVPPREGYRGGPRPAVAHPLNDEIHAATSAASRFDVVDVRVDPVEGTAPVGSDVTVLHEIARLGAHRFAARAIDDRFGDAALIMAARELWPERHHLPNTVWLVWSVEEETGLKGATWLADSLAHHGALPIRVHAVDTFVSSDSPLEDPRIGGARLGQGAVIRAVDTSHEAPPEAVRATLALARREGIPLQCGVTAGGNDGVPFAEHGSINVPLGWPLRSSHTAVEVADLRDLESLARLVKVLAEQPARDDVHLP